jgi:uncharacterized SAM-binding protein YcdF (DUF218 family)
MHLTGVPKLWRRREVWLPTLWGGLLMLLTAGAAMLALGRWANDLFAVNDPAAQARTLVVEGWIDAGDLAQAARVAQRGAYERVLAVGAPLDPWDDVGGWHDCAQRAAQYLLHHGVRAVPVLTLPTAAVRRDRSYENALTVRQWAIRSHVELGAIDVFTSGVHARRSRLLYRMALGSGVAVGVLAANPQDYDAVHWWRSSEGIKRLIDEAVGLPWTICCFWPEPPR